MKKFISAIAAISICAFMFAACGDNGSADENPTESVTSEASAAEDTVNEEPEESDAADDTNTDMDNKTDDNEDIPNDNEIISDNEDDIIADDEEDTVTDSGDMLSFDSFDDIDTDQIFAVDYEYINAEESNLYSFAKTLEGNAEFYIDAEATDGSVSIVMAFSQDKIAMNVFEGSTATEISVIIKDNTMYMLSPSEKTGIYFAADESMMEQYDLESMLSQANIDSDIDLAEVKAAAVLIEGKEYVFEFNNKSGMLFDTDGKLCAIISADGSNGINTMLVNEFSSDIPADAFDIPDDYTITDLESALSAVE